MLYANKMRSLRFMLRKADSEIMKKRIFVTCVMLAMLLSGCSNKEEWSATSSSETTTEPIGTSSDIDSTSPTTFSFSTSLNAFSPQNAFAPIGNQMEINKGETVRLKFLSNVSPDKSMTTDDIPMRMWVIADGVPIEFSVNNEAPHAVNDIFVDALEDVTTEVSFVCSDDVSIITIECVYFPEDIPERGLGSYGGEISYTIVNTAYSSVDKFHDADDEFYINVPLQNENYGIDIGVLSVAENNNRVQETHFYNDVVFNAKEDDLFIKFNSGDSKESRYYILVLCDGRIVEAFDHHGRHVSPELRITARLKCPSTLWASLISTTPSVFTSPRV